MYLPTRASPITMPLQMKGTHAFCASNASVGAVHTLSRAASKAPVGESSGQVCQQPTPPLLAFRGEADLETDLSNHDHSRMPNPLSSPVHHPPLSQTSADTSNSNKHKCSALDDMISTSGGTSEGGGSAKHSVTRPSGLVVLNTVATQLGEFNSKFEKVMMLQATPCRTETSPECRMAAIKHLQELEANHLDLNHLIVLVDYFKSSSDATVTYLLLDLPVLHHGWLQKQLVESLAFQLMKQWGKWYTIE